MTNVIEARGLTKSYGSFVAVNDVSFDIPLGRIVGVIGANGAGKTTLLNAILGLTGFEGELSVLGMNPATSRSRLMQDVCFISDVATLPRWMRVKDVLKYVEGVHTKFDPQKALDYLARTKIPMGKKVRALSKGMVVQLHLAIVMSIDAALLVLDEPTLGLDIIFRKRFYSDLLGEYFDHERTIIVTTHQVEEIEHILTDAMFIRDGELALYDEMDKIAEDFVEITVDAANIDALRAMNPISEEKRMGRATFIFKGADRARLREFGDLKMVGLADLFVAIMTGGEL